MFREAHEGIVVDDSSAPDDIAEIESLTEEQRKEALKRMGELEEDFTIGNYRFIYFDVQYDIFEDEILEDPLALGKIAQVTYWATEDLGFSEEFLDSLETDEQFKALGEALIAMDKYDYICQEFGVDQTCGPHYAIDDEEIEIGYSYYYAYRVK